jgi:hypothetical protein
VRARDSGVPTLDAKCASRMGHPDFGVGWRVQKQILRFAQDDNSSSQGDRSLLGRTESAFQRIL